MSSFSNEDSSISSASSYVETYMDCEYCPGWWISSIGQGNNISIYISCLLFNVLDVEALPDDLQRDISQMREIDLVYQGMVM